MQTKKRLTEILLFVGLLLFGIQSCEKYSDNNGISFKSRTERVSNTWKVDNYKLNGVDYTSLLSGYTETYTSEGDYSFQWAIIGGTATWSFQNNDREIQLTGISNQESRTLYILKLEDTQFWYYYMDGNDKKEFHFIQQ